MDLTAVWLSLIPIGVGAFFSYSSYKLHKLIKLAKETETSDIRMVKEGLAEIKGHAVKKEKVLKSPLSGSDCFYYKYIVEEPKRDKKGHTHWKTIATASQSVPFHLKDETGEIEILPDRAEIEMISSADFLIGPGKEPPLSIKNFIDENKISYKGLFGTKSMKFREFMIKPKETLYILGVVASNNEQKNSRFIIKKAKDIFYISGCEEKKIMDLLYKRMLVNLAGGFFFILLGLGLLFFLMKSIWP